VKIIGHDPDRRCASLYVIDRLIGCFSSFWISPFGQVMRTVSISLTSRSPKVSGVPV
jgi:hypothetical protein